MYIVHLQFNFILSLYSTFVYNINLCTIVPTQVDGGAARVPRSDLD